MKASPWRKSSRSGGGGSNCVEARTHRGRLQLRDSKLGDTGPILDIPTTDFTSLLTELKR